MAPGTRENAGMFALRKALVINQDLIKTGESVDRQRSSALTRLTWLGEVIEPQFPFWPRSASVTWLSPRSRAVLCTCIM